MSEAERRQRQEYKIKRKRRIYIQTIALIILVALSLGSFYIYDQMNSTYYVEYGEGGSIDYKVDYIENEYFENEPIESGKSYISSLVDGINADFKYNFNIGAPDVSFNYSYDIVAEVVIADKTSKEVIYKYQDVLVPNKVVDSKNKSSFAIKESVTADFARYDGMAREFVEVYGLKNASTTLNVTFNVKTVASCDKFEESKTVSHQNTLVVPLGEVNFSIYSSTKAPSGEPKLIAYEGMVNRDLFFIIAVSAAALAVIMMIVLIAYINVTKNDDVNYVIKVRRLLSTYRSFIQQIEGEFNDEGYQRVEIKTFTEMLGIRDTIQSPILMSENRDETMTQFLIPTNTKLLYTFEIKVDNYDEIYSSRAEVEAAEAAGV